MSKALILACLISVANALVASPAVLQARGRAVAPVKMVDPAGWCAPLPRVTLPRMRRIRLILVLT